MKAKNILFLAVILGTIFSLSYVANSLTPFRGFIVNLPAEVDVNPGQTVVINGSILNIGFYWEHQFNLTSSGFPSSYAVTFTPGYWEDMMTIRAWDPVNGLYKVPVPFNVTIVIPSDAISGVYALNVTGQEFQSSRYVHNNSIAILRVGGAAVPNTTQTQGTISISQIIVPESVKEFVPFNISFDVVNSGTQSQNVSISLQGPSDWTLTASQSVAVPAGGSVPLVFSAIPTSTAGSVAVVLSYPYQQTILNITKAGPYLVPVSASASSPSASSNPVAQFSTTALASFVQQNTILTIIIVVVVLILIWYFTSTYNFYSKRKKPEEMKKKENETKNKKIDTSSQDEAIKKQ